MNSVGDSRRSLDENVCEAKIIEVDEVNPENVSQNMRSPSVDLYKETLDEIINRLQLENTLLKNNNVTLRRYLKLALQSIEPFSGCDETEREVVDTDVNGSALDKNLR